MTQALNLGLLGNFVNTSGQVGLATGVTGTLPIANGGTNATNAATALANLGGIGGSSPTITTPTIAIIKSNSLTAPTQFQNSSGTQIGTLCRAWVNFDGTTATIRASFNVSSITRTSTGFYTINLTNALTDTNYSVIGTSGVTFGTGGSYGNIVFESLDSGQALTSRTTSAFNIVTFSGGISGLDSADVNIAVLR